MHGTPLALAAADVTTLGGMPVDALVLLAGLAVLAVLVVRDTVRRLKRKA